MQRVNSYSISIASKPERHVLGSYFDHLTTENAEAEAKVRKPRGEHTRPGCGARHPKMVEVER